MLCMNIFSLFFYVISKYDYGILMFVNCKIFILFCFNRLSYDFKLFYLIYFFIFN